MFWEVDILIREGKSDSVLILVLMDDVLGASEKMTLNFTPHPVLILVLMDDVLGGVF